MSILYLDCFAGIAGDMMLGALLDTGVDEDAFRGQLAKLGLADEYELIIKKKVQKGIAGTDVDVIDKNNPGHMHHTHAEHAPGDPHHGEHHSHAEHAPDDAHHGEHHGHAADGHSHADHSHVADGRHSHADHTHSEHGEHALQTDHAGHTHHHENHAHPHYGHNHGGEYHSHEGIRNYADICSIIEACGITSGAKARALSIFKRVAVAEAKVHGVPVDKVHFHEVGAIDSIVDIVGSAILLDMLSPDKIVCSPIHVGSGIARAAHGLFGVPAPATAIILEGCPIYATEIKGELCTPTGAAIAAAMSNSFGPLPAMLTDRVGHGMGKKDFGILNFLRVFLGHEGASRESVTLLEANIDDMTGEALGFAMDALLEAGALDVWFEPIYMKKNRPAFKLCALAGGDVPRLERTIFNNTTTIGIRRSIRERSVLPRRQVELHTDYGVIQAKAVQRPAGETVKPEHDSVSQAATDSGMPYAMVYQAALASINESAK